MPDPTEPAAVHPAMAELTEAPVDLGPSDVLWLQRLPIDPAEVSDDDVVILERLALATRPGSADRRLVEAVLGPAAAHREKPAAKTRPLVRETMRKDA